MASVGSSLSSAHVAAQLRRLSRNIGSAQNQDALEVQDMDNVSGEENFDAWRPIVNRSEQRRIWATAEAMIQCQSIIEER